MVLKMFMDVGAYYVFHDVTRHTGKGNWSVVFGQIFVPFFIDRRDICSGPITVEGTWVYRLLVKCRQGRREFDG